LSLWPVRAEGGSGRNQHRDDHDSNTRLVNGNLNFAATNYSVLESNLVAQLVVTRNFGSSGAISVPYTTADGTAQAGADYAQTSGVLSWAAGDAGSRMISVPIINDSVVEDSEIFVVSLGTPTGGATLGGGPSTTVTIRDEDVGPGLLGFTAASYRVDENGTNAFITVQRTFGRAGENAISFRTLDGAGTAQAGADYISTNGTLQFLDGETNKTFQVRILDNQVVQADKTLWLELYNPLYPASTNNQIVAAELTILENEPQAGSVDLSFNAAPDNQVYAILLQTNTSKLYAGGDFKQVNNYQRSHVVRFNANGTVDSTFDPTTNITSSVRAIALQHVTNLLVGGVFTNAGGSGRSY